MDVARLEALARQAQQEDDDLEALVRIAAEVNELAPRSCVAPDDVLATRAGILRRVGARAMATGTRMPRAPSASAPARSPCRVLDTTVLEVVALDAFLRLRFAPDDPAARQAVLPVALEMLERAHDGDLQEALGRDLARLQRAEPWPRLEVITFGPHRVEAFPIGGDALVTVDGTYQRVLEGIGAEPPTVTAAPRWPRLAPFFGSVAPAADSTLVVTVRTPGAHFRQYTDRSTVLSLTASGRPQLVVSALGTDESYY